MPNHNNNVSAFKITNNNQEYNYKIPAAASQSKIQSFGGDHHREGGHVGSAPGSHHGAQSIGAVYRGVGNSRKFMNGPHLISEMNRSTGTSPDGGQMPMNRHRQQRAATQGGNLFGGSIGRSHAYAQ